MSNQFCKPRSNQRLSSCTKVIDGLILSPVTSDASRRSTEGLQEPNRAALVTNSAQTKTSVFACDQTANDIAVTLSYLAVRALNLWKHDHHRSDKMKEPHDRQLPIE